MKKFLRLRPCWELLYTEHKRDNHVSKKLQKNRQLIIKMVFVHKQLVLVKGPHFYAAFLYKS